MEFRNSKQNFAMMASKFTMATWYTDRVEVDFCSKTQFSPGPHQHQSECKYDSYF